LSSDSDSDVHPPLPEFKRWSEPVHMVAIPYMGMPLLCIAGLDEISAVCGDGIFSSASRRGGSRARRARLAIPWRSSDKDRTKGLQTCAELMLSMTNPGLRAFERYAEE
jgi:hypothetical protein